jgi:uncharacterized membrane protein YkoI
MVKLNLPEYQFRIQKSEKGTQIFDAIRKKFVALTPEEWVRQNFIQFLIVEKKYPASLIAVETGLKYNRLQKRSDITIYDRNGKLWMIVECKAPEVKISQETFDQVATYNMSGKVKTRFLAVTNGLKHYCCEILNDQNSYDFLKDFPDFS